MSWNPFSHNSNQVYDNRYTPGGYEKAKLKKLLLVVVGVFAAIVIVALIVQLLPQSRYTRSATAAARKVTPHAKVTNVKVAGGFALALVSDPTTTGQANAGNITVFKVNTDGSMTQIANGSSFDTLDLLELGMPLTTQAKLNGSSIKQVKQNLASTCDYNGGSAPGFSGFEGSFDPDGWQISSTSLNGLEQSLTTVISNKNTGLPSDKTIVCVNATRNGSSKSIDTNTYVSTFTLQIQFITSSGTLTKHTFTFAVEPKNHRSYTLDGQGI